MMGDVNTEACDKLKCLHCQPVEEHDDDLKECLEAVARAVIASLSDRKQDAAVRQNLWYFVGQTFADSMKSGLTLPESFVYCNPQHRRSMWPAG